MIAASRWVVLGGVLAVAFLAAFDAHGLPTVEKTLPMGNGTAGIAVDPVLGHVYVTNFNDGTGLAVDIASLTASAPLPLGTNPRRLIDDAAHHRVYIVLSTTPGTLLIGETNSDSPIVSVAVGNNPRALGANFQLGRVYVTNLDSNTVSVVDTITRTVIATIPIGNGGATPVSNGLVKKVYVPNVSDGTVTVIDEVTLTVLKTIKVGRTPQYCAIDGRHAKVYCNNVTDRTISVLDSTTDTVIKTIPSGAGTSNNFGAVSAVYRRYYLPNQVDGTLTIVDTDTDTVTHTVTVGSAPFAVHLDPVGGDVYVVNNGSDSVSVINAATETSVGSFPVGGAPWRMAGGLGHLFILNTNGTAVDTMTIATENNSIPGTAIATEYYHKEFDHYFHTADEAETRVLEDGAFHDDWHRTFQFFRVWTTAGTGRLPVSRFFSTQWGSKSSHFYTANADEREKLVSGTIPGWQLEADGLYYIALADAAGNCPADTSPLYRLFNDGQGGAPNHRLTTERPTRDAMVRQGWVSEGQGPDTIYGCVPGLLTG